MLNGAGLFTYKTWVVLVVNVGKYTSPIEEFLGAKFRFEFLDFLGYPLLLMVRGFEIRR